MTLECEQNDRDVLEALGEYNCDAGMSVKNVPTVLHKNTEGTIQVIAHKFWVCGVCGEECGEGEEFCWPVCSQG